jgi:hypothetical protein
MNPQIFDLADLPLEDLAAIGLARDKELLLEQADLKALLSGRRTQMLKLENLEFAGMKIASLKAKLQLVTRADGKPELLLHPAYLHSIKPRYLSDEEAEALESGEKVSFEKNIVDGSGQRKRVLFEFDPETKQFLQTDLDKVIAPEKVNNEPLTGEQKERFRRGLEIELKDGTKLRYTAATREGIRANRIALIASIVFDGGISFLLFHSIKALVGQLHDARSTEQSEGYQEALEEMEQQQEEEPLPQLQLISGGLDTGNNRGNGRNGSR